VGKVAVWLTGPSVKPRGSVAIEVHLPHGKRSSESVEGIVSILPLVPIARVAKPLLTRTVFRPGTVRTIFRGPSAGLRYRIFPDFGIAPVYGGWEPEAQQVMVRHVHSGSVVYDIGANRGVHTLLFCRLAGPEGFVYSFEPVASFRADLEENVRLNGFRNFAAVEQAASEECGSVTFFRGHHDGAGHIEGAGDTRGDTFEVQTITLDAFVLDNASRPPTFVKMDVEGAEGRVMAGARQVIDRYRPTFLIDLHTPDQDLAVGAVLAEFDYRVYRIRGDQIEPIHDLSRGWPEPTGIWGQILAVPHAGITP
jgi:FkbM family methyltransferase